MRYGNAKSEGESRASDGPVSVTANGSYETSKGASPTAAGTYYWVEIGRASCREKVMVSGCADALITVGPDSPSIETTQKPATGTVGDTFKDSAKIAGLFGEHPRGTIS